jgi:glycosyltransferase involved in cell wall biosynthesis
MNCPHSFRDRVAAVVIGRNEGLRLQMCLESVLAEVTAIVYVDSGSQDGSLATAQAAGAAVVELDMSQHSARRAPETVVWRNCCIGSCRRLRAVSRW